MIIAQKTTIVMYSFFVPPGVFPSDRTKHVSNVPRYSHSKIILRYLPGVKPNVGSAKATVKILNTKKKLPYSP
jgi:hypothetical protein